MCLFSLRKRGKLCRERHTAATTTAATRTRRCRKSSTVLDRSFVRQWRTSVYRNGLCASSGAPSVDWRFYCAGRARGLDTCCATMSACGTRTGDSGRRWIPLATTCGRSRIGGSERPVVYERVQGEEAAFCHGKATIKPWESHGVEALSELHRTYGAWVDLRA